jgi:transposase
MGLEIISGVERRRRWSVADKLRIVAEADEAGATVAEVARRHEISRSILWAWRKQARAGVLARIIHLELADVVYPYEISYDFAAESQNTRIQRPHPPWWKLSHLCPACHLFLARR